ncbi:AfsR/SARP family transcriptional regulator [Streptomyces formicae]|uniref:Putative regulatory protein (AfsR-like protein) n=1 Tax=Streptomyces formicae TaxID=1616117 RepID=A0A291QHX0_9ACTN|nr:AfsR/SARP family transcriptional regulator [Streptomyces formicae]ATL31035.1 putative regulatory protein (AfsR-like protein) [Streptomyces formicae]
MSTSACGTDAALAPADAPDPAAGPRPAMQMRLLGPMEASLGGEPMLLGGSRQQTVLAALALEANRVIPLDRLIRAVWDDAPPSTARSQIHICISALRRILAVGEAPLIVTRSPGYMLALPQDNIDAHWFDSLVTQGRTAAGQGHTAAAADSLREALTLWRGPALSGIPSRIVQAGATKLDEARMAATEERIRLDLRLGRHHEIIGELHALTAAEPFRETPQAQLMLALYRSGRQAEALETYQRVRATFAAELGIEPGEELRRLHHDILAGHARLDLVTQQAERAGNRAPGPVEIVSTPRQLPGGIHDFVGRTRELARIRAALLPDQEGADGAPAPPRVMAISGQAGAGKSTLAVRAAHEVSEVFGDGQLYADLGGFRDPARSAHEVMGGFLRALGVAAHVIPDDARERTELYRSRLAAARVLIVIDNAVSEQQVTRLSPGSGRCAVIATSRSRLTGLPGAHQLDLCVLGRKESEEFLTRILGTERATADPAALGALARRCGGLPLALRIAGARLAARAHWPVGRLVERLGDEDQLLGELVHGELQFRACLQESYEALDPAARALFRRLALLDAPDFSGWIAAALCDRSLLEAEDLLDTLVDARLIEAGTGARGQGARYRFPDLVRAYARERLRQEEPQPERRAALLRTLGTWLALAEEAHRKEYGGDFLLVHGDAPRWRLPKAFTDRLLRRPMAWLESERRCLTAAVLQAADHQLPEHCWDLALTSTTLFAAGGHFADWRQTASAAIGATEQYEIPRGRAASHYSMGSLHSAQGRLDRAAAHFDTALGLFTALGDDRGAGLVLTALGDVNRRLGHDATALRQWAAGLRALCRAGDQVGQARVLCAMARARLAEGDYPRARRHLVKALGACRRARSSRAEAPVRLLFGQLHLRTGRLGSAERGFHWALRVARADGDRACEVRALHGLGLVRRGQGRPGPARTALSQALELARQTGDRELAEQVGRSLVAPSQAGERSCPPSHDSV